MTDKEARNCRACSEKYEEALRAERERVKELAQHIVNEYESDWDMPEGLLKEARQLLSREDSDG